MLLRVEELQTNNCACLLMVQNVYQRQDSILQPILDSLNVSICVATVQTTRAMCKATKEKQEPPGL